MKKRYTILALSLIGIQSAQFAISNYTDQRNVGCQIMRTLSANADSVSTPNIKTDNAKLDELSKDPTAIDKATDINVDEMNKQDLSNFEAIISAEAQKAKMPTKEDEEAYKQALYDFFDSKSDIYQDATAATTQVIDEINENHEDILDKISGEKVMAASHGALSVKMAGTIINITISVAFTKGAGSVAQTLVRKYGAAQARRMMERTLRNALVKIAGMKAEKYAGQLVDVVMTAIDPGTAAAKWIDHNDKIRNNGWIELW